MSLSSEVRTGRWTDHSNHHRFQTLQSDFWATWFKTAVAVGLVLSGPYLYAITQSTVLGIYQHWAPERRREATGSQNDDEATAGLIVRNAFKEAKGSRGAVKNFYRATYEEGSKFAARHKAGMVFVLVVLFLVFVSQVAFSGLIAAKIVTDRTALLKSATCGLWEFDVQEGGNDDASRADIAMAERERRAAEYAQNCYGVNKKSEALQCNFFISPSIKYSKKEDTCPFHDHQVCVDGYTPGAAVTFDTGLVDSYHLGINYNPTYKFRRTTTCSPLNADSPYVRHVNIGDGGYLYYYGALYNTTCSTSNHTSKMIQNYTLYTTGKPFQWLAPVYRVDTFATYLGAPECDFYQPSTSLRAPGLGINDPKEKNSTNAPARNKTLAIIFITPLHILYTKPSNDPIFRADKPYRPPGATRDYYYNGNPKARALACIDETQLCDHSGKECWHIHDAPKSAKDSPSYWFMKHALNNSNTYDSIKDRLGRALLAQQRVGQYRSLALPDDHWKAESENLFKTSLARAQFDAWSIASGEDSSIATYHNVISEEEGKNDLCGMYKFQSIGYVNVRISLFVVMMFILPFCALMSVRTNTVVGKLKSFVPWTKKDRRTTPEADGLDSSQQDRGDTGVAAPPATSISSSGRPSGAEATATTGLVANENVDRQQSRNRYYGAMNSRSSSVPSSIRANSIDDQENAANPSTSHWAEPRDSGIGILSVGSIRVIFTYPGDTKDVGGEWEPLLFHTLFLKPLWFIICIPNWLWNLSRQHTSHSEVRRAG